MCGRYVATAPTSVLVDEFDIDDVTDEMAADPVASFNVAPTDPVPAVAVNRAGSRVLGQYRWGLVPSWAADAKGAAGMINARAESVLSKPAYRTAFERRRCLLPADGFYEWERRDDGSKQPWFTKRADGRPLAFAGLWEVWRPKDAGPEVPLLRTCSVITTAANELMVPVHDRMPVVLERDVWDEWLDRANTDTSALHALLVPAGPDILVRYAVGTKVNSVRNNGPDLIDPAPPVPLGML